MVRFEMGKIFIKNATIVDGTKAARWLGNIAIEDDRIVREEGFVCDDTTIIIDATGLTCTPGFIDTHSHSDVQVLIDPVLTPKICQGITTEILGQDGVSVAPLPLRFKEEWRNYIKGLNGDSPELQWDWETTDRYLSLIEQGKGCAANVGYLAPHGNVRMEVMGLDNRQATSLEIQQMCAVLERELAAGAIGLSSGLIYVPCAYCATDELIQLCKVVAKHNKPFVVHQRSEADTIIKSMQEIFHIGKESGVHVHFSHFKICGKRNLHYFKTMAQLLDNAKLEGISVSFDQYPYHAGSTTMTALLPPWAQSGGSHKTLQRLRNAQVRKQIANDIRKGIEGWDNFISFAGFDDIRITSVASLNNSNVAGKSLAELGQMRNTGVLDAMFDLLLEEELAVSITTEFGTEREVAFFLQREEQNVCTDGLFGLKPHPRVYGTFARILQNYVRETKSLTLEEAVWKMSGKAAQVFNLVDRGVLKAGKKADVLLFDADAIVDHATYQDPIRFPTGFEVVIVNGVIVCRGGQQLDVTPGEVIRLRTNVN